MSEFDNQRETDQKSLLTGLVFIGMESVLTDEKIENAVVSGTPKKRIFYKISGISCYIMYIDFSLPSHKLIDILNFYDVFLFELYFNSHF